MAERPLSKWRLHSSQYLGEISALCFLHLPYHLSSLPYLLAGSGSQMLLYDLEKGTMVRSFHVFEGIRVHGFTCSFADCIEGSSSTKLAYKLALFGEKRVKLFSLNVELPLRSQRQPEFCLDLTLVQLLPRFSHWVLDVCFLKGSVCSSHKPGDCLAIGCSDNSVRLWDISNSSVILELQSPERCLLYSMRLWGDKLEDLRIASGTIFNEIIVWKVVSLYGTPFGRTVEDQANLSGSISNSDGLDYQQYEVVNICRLAGHEGSIFRIVWASDGSKLVSVSDDRSARIWGVEAEHRDSNNSRGHGPVLFGHSARVWDCCISDSLIVTAGEDCTCRVWGLDGKQLKMIKEHIGRGIWRCLYDPNSSLLVTAGFDSAIKVHQLHTSLAGGLEENAEAKEFIDRTKLSTVRIPNLSEHSGLMDSKSEYVRCLHFTCQDTIYVATNHGYLYHVNLPNVGNAKWTQLVRISEEGPAICMDLLPKKIPDCSCGLDDWIALGDGKGNMTVVRVVDDACSPKVGFTLSWSAGPERQLLGTYWCRSLGYRYVFTADPRGILKLWRLSDPQAFISYDSARTYDVCLIAEFSSCFGARIMCLDASLEEEVLVCGDLRGNLVLFPLLKGMLVGTSTVSEVKIPPLNYFKGAHGISSVSSLSLARLASSQVEIRSTGGDGCLCYLEYDKDRQTLEFIGMKQVKELSLIESVSDSNLTDDQANLSYVAGFMSTDFMIWNLATETKVVQISCGGWRRPHSFYLGDLPETKNCFAYVKDEIIYIHRHWVEESGRKMFPLNLHLQFHGREIHSICFTSSDSKVETTGKGLFDESSWIATGCEDGTVRLTRYTPGVENWSTSKLLGEHVGGSAVRSICFVSKIHIIASNVTDMPDKSSELNVAAEDRENPFLMISVGAKRVLTSWLLRSRRPDNKEDSLIEQQQNGNRNSCKSSSRLSSPMSFQWLSTDMPTKNSSVCGRMENHEKIPGVTNARANLESVFLENNETEYKMCLGEKYEDDLRYLAVTAFLVKCAGSRLTICFVVVACSDATLVLRALILPHRLWFDVAFLVPLSSPVLALQHVVIPMHLSSEENVHSRSLYVVISGGTDGTLAFWDLTESVEAFVWRASTLHVEKLIDCQKRPRTGRGSQGGRRWRSLGSAMSKKKSIGDLAAARTGEGANGKLLNDAACGTYRKLDGMESSTAVCSPAAYGAFNESEVNMVDSSLEICEIQPIHVLSNVHQSGINCLHISHLKDGQNSDYGLFNIISGGDDQALHCLTFDLSFVSMDLDSKTMRLDITDSLTESRGIKNPIHNSQKQMQSYGIRFLDNQRIASAHGSAIKGVWTDGIWVFSTGLDQRIRCWHLEEHGKMVEHAHKIVSVPEPEALDARAFGKNHYQIVVAGRGMQIIEFFAS